MNGKIKKVVPKGYGFLMVEGRTKEVFFHAAGLKLGTIFNNLKEGDNVILDGIEETPKGEQAYGIEVV